MSDQSGCIKITARGSASQGKNDTVFLDKLVVGNTYMLMNLEWARELMAIINSNTSIVHLLRQCIITAELLVLATIRISEGVDLSRANPAWENDMSVMNCWVVSDQSGSIKITAWGSASQGKNDTVFLDKLVVGNTYMLMNFECDSLKAVHKHC